MKAFQVNLNGRKLCTAGFLEQGVLAAIVDYVNNHGRDELAISVGGLISSKQEHLRWVNRRSLRVGDEIHVKIIEAEVADNPRQRQRHDASADLKHQKQYIREIVKKFGWSITTGSSGRHKNA